LSYGIPIIARNVGGINEIVVDGYNGTLLKKDSTYNDIAKAIEKFAVQPFDEIIKIRSNCLKTWQSKFDANKNYNIFIANIKK
jgi:glycosyltransferase involved in cell wall biosynthesis